MTEKAILVVSFGTSYKETRERTITAIENSLQDAFREYKVYRAFTSRKIKQKMEKEGVFVLDVKEPLEQMLLDGIKELFVQPTYMINGREYDFLIEELQPYLHKFETIRCGQSLLACKEDYKELATIIGNAYPVEEDEVLVLMGHGSEHSMNGAYSNFEYVLHHMDYDNILVGTMKGYPAFSEVKRKLKEKNAKKICLAPMMIVAGKHVNKDMIGEKDSWRAELEQEGYEVRYYRKGLGELPGVQNMFIRHVRECF